MGCMFQSLRVAAWTTIELLKQSVTFIPPFVSPTSLFKRQWSQTLEHLLHWIRFINYLSLIFIDVDIIFYDNTAFIFIYLHLYNEARVSRQTSQWFSLISLFRSKTEKWAHLKCNVRISLCTGNSIGEVHVNSGRLSRSRDTTANKLIH